MGPGLKQSDTVDGLVQRSNISVAALSIARKHTQVPRCPEVMSWAAERGGVVVEATRLKQVGLAMAEWRSN